MTPETIAELRRRHAAATPFALRFLSNGPGGEPFIALACEDGSTPLPEPAFDAVLLFAELAAAELPALLDAAADRDRLARLLDEPRRSGCAVEISGVRIAPCDERGQTADMLAAERRAAERDALAAKVERVRALHPRDDDMCCNCGQPHPCDTRAALDEEPQP